MELGSSWPWGSRNAFLFTIYFCEYRYIHRYIVHCRCTLYSNICKFVTDLADGDVTFLSDLADGDIIALRDFKDGDVPALSDFAYGIAKFLNDLADGDVTSWT